MPPFERLAPGDRLKKELRGGELYGISVHRSDAALRMRYFEQIVWYYQQQVQSGHWSGHKQ
jgi:hypothetical protein